MLPLTDHKPVRRVQGLNIQTFLQQEPSKQSIKLYPPTQGFALNHEINRLKEEIHHSYWHVRYRQEYRSEGTCKIHSV